MNLGQNNTLDQLFENSELTIKQDLRVGPCEEVVRRGLEALEAMETLGRSSDFGAGVGALGIVNRNIERLERERYVGANVSIGYITEEATVREPATLGAYWEDSHSFTATQQLVGLVNHPKSQRAGAGGGRRAMIMLGLALAECGSSINDVVVIGAGGPIQRAGHFDYAAFDDCSHFDNDLSAHPGERHRQLSRKLTSPRSRAGKASRWK